MKTQIKTWGNSQAIRIPKYMLEEAGFHDCDDLNIEVWDHKIVISKIHRRLSLEERIEKFGPICRFPETEWGKPVGREEL